MNNQPQSSPAIRLKKIRNEFRLNQKEFAEKLRFNQSYYSELERAKKAMTIQALKALIERFNVSADWMLTGQGPMLLNEGQANPPSEVPSEGFMDTLPSLADGEDWQITHWLAIQETAADFRNEYSKAFRRLQTIVGIIEQADWSEAQKLKAIYTICKGGEKLTDSIQLKKP